MHKKYKIIIYGHWGKRGMWHEYKRISYLTHSIPLPNTDSKKTGALKNVLRSFLKTESVLKKVIK